MKATIVIEGKTFKEFPNLIQDNYGEDIQFNLLQESGSAFIIETDSSVFFKARKTDATTNKIDGLCTIVDGSSGIITYTLVDGDLSETGKFVTEVEVSSPTKIVSSKLGDLVILESI